ncbi:hypothetical protein MXB_5191, partial [Myxobolus squamalis]
MYLLKLLSLYHKTKNLFIRSYDPYFKQFNNGNNLIVLFRSLTEQYYFNKSQYFLEFIPFNIYHNLLVSCIPDFKSYKEILTPQSKVNIHGHHNTGTVFESDEISDIFMDTLIKNNFLYHTVKFMPDIKLNLKSKIYAIKCLLVLLTREIATPIILILKEDLIYALKQSITIIKSLIEVDEEIRLF